MQTKIYFAGSVPAALEAARHDIGIEAMLLSSRLAPPEMRHLGRLEVTFAFSPKEDAPAPAADATELTERIPVAAFTLPRGGEYKSLAFVGPAGRGKTSSLVKVAVRYGLANRIPVRIYSAGAHSVGGQEQMARYASILGVPFQACESMESLTLALNGVEAKGLTLIDTPALPRNNRAESEEMIRFFARHTDIESHLVLRADARSADMSDMVNRYAALSPSRLLFTGLDEAGSTSAMVDTLLRHRIPACFAGNGPQIPEDLEEVNASRLARSAFAAGSAAAAA